MTGTPEEQKLDEIRENRKAIDAGDVARASRAKLYQDARDLGIHDSVIAEAAGVERNTIRQTITRAAKG